jgi:hypothetical protein
MASNTKFQGAADLTFQVAAQLYGEGSAEQNAVRYGWESVGIMIGAQVPVPPSPTGCSVAPLRALRSLLPR